MEMFQYPYIPASYFSRAILNLSQVTNGLRLVISLSPLENSCILVKIAIHFDIVTAVA